MKLIDTIKEMLGKDFNANEVIDTLQAEVDEAKALIQETEADKESSEREGYANRLTTARAGQHKRMAVRKNQMHQMKISQARLHMLKKQGKI